MSYPSDYRYLPFSDTPNYVSKTEYYQIPATSPYEVRLNEVPEKASPSTMTIKIVTGFSGGSPVYGATMTEVSATPASGEYYPDYYTEADGDSNWNTGTIQFNSANANTTIEVTYMATGGLASVKSNHYPSWMTDRGDGSDGVFAPTSNVTLDGGEYNYKAVIIPSGVTVTLSNKTLFKVQGMFNNQGTIVVAAVGGRGGYGCSMMEYDREATCAYGYPTPTKGDDCFGGGNGGAGANGGDWGGAAGGKGLLVKIPTDWLCLGGAGGGGGGGYYTSGTLTERGGDGGKGGGVVAVVANSIYNSGTITANGENSGTTVWVAHKLSYDDQYYVECGYRGVTYRGGGGGGGVIILAANTVRNTGTCNVNGGTGGNNGAVGAVKSITIGG